MISTCCDVVLTMAAAWRGQNYYAQKLCHNQRKRRECPETNQMWGVDWAIGQHCVNSRVSLECSGECEPRPLLCSL